MTRLPPLRDPDIRVPLVRELTRPGTRLRLEMGLWDCVADVVAATSQCLHVYEIKSDRDTLDRLPDQARAYNHTAGAVTLAVGAKLLDVALVTVPRWWGVTLARRSADDPLRVELLPLREALPNPTPMWRAVFGVLWRGEALGALRAWGLGKGMASASKPRMARRAREAGITVAQVQAAVNAALLVREWNDRP